MGNFNTTVHEAFINSIFLWRYAEFSALLVQKSQKRDTMLPKLSYPNNNSLEISWQLCYVIVSRFCGSLI